MTSVAIDANNAIHIIKNNNLISVTNQGTSVFNNGTSLYGIYDINKLNNINAGTSNSDIVLNSINSQLGDLSAITNNRTLAVIINDMLTQLTTLNLPLAPTNGISSESIIFNDIHFTTSRISGALSWTIPSTLTNITHFEAFYQLIN